MHCSAGKDSKSSSLSPSTFSHHCPPYLLHLPFYLPLEYSLTDNSTGTGLFISLLLSLLHLDPQIIAHEYSLTDLGLAHRKSAIVDHVMLDPAFDGDRAAAERMVSSRKEAMLATLKYIDEEYGGAEKYVVEKLGVLPEEVQRIRQVMVVDVEEGGETINWRANAEVVERIYQH